MSDNVSSNTGNGINGNGSNCGKSGGSQVKSEASPNNSLNRGLWRSKSFSHGHRSRKAPVSGPTIEDMISEKPKNIKKSKKLIGTTKKGKCDVEEKTVSDKVVSPLQRSNSGSDKVVSPWQRSNSGSGKVVSPLQRSKSMRMKTPNHTRTTEFTVRKEEVTLLAESITEGFSSEKTRRRGVRSSSYMIISGEEDDMIEMSPPLLLHSEEESVECGEKPGTLNVVTQTEQVPAGLSAETSLELLKKLSMPALRRELERKKVRFSKNDGKDQLQAKLEAVLKLETCPPTCPLTRGKITIHSEPAELKKRAQQIAGMAHNTDTPQVLGEASKQLSQVTQEVRVIRQLLEAHVHHLRAVSEHSTTECGCDMMLENLCHSLSHYHVRKLESQLQETLSEINMLQLEKHSLLRAVSRLCNKRGSPSPRPFSATLPRRNLHNNTATSPAYQIGNMTGRSQPCQQANPACTPCEHGDCRIDYLANLMSSVLQQNHN